MACGSPQSEPDLQLRFDGPHHRKSGVEGDAISTPAEVATNPNGLAVANLSRVRNHASQLASHLQGLSDDIDRREAELNSREARVESDIRGLHLSIESQQDQLGKQVEQIDVQEKSLRKAAERLLALGGSKIDSVSSHLGTSELIRQVESVVESILGGMRHPHQPGSRQTDSKKQARPTFATENEQPQLDLAVATLVKRQKELQEKEERLSRIRQQDEATSHQMHSEFAQKQQTLEHQWDKRKATLQRRAATLDNRQQSLDQSHREIANACQETLQIFLDAERLWSQIPQLAAQPQLALELERIGRQLTMRYGAVQEDLRREKGELIAAETNLKHQYARILQEKQCLEKSMAEQRQWSEERAAALAIRERRLDQQEADRAMQIELWNRERHHLQQQILQLQSELRRAPTKTNRSDVSDRANNLK